MQDPQFSYLNDLSKDEQIAEAKILIQATFGGQPSDLFQSKEFRDQMLETLIAENPDMAKIKDLSEEKQKRMLTLLYSIGAATN